jgi:NAD(P)-dependent dehydrogenase (short-subunit alcohol dehydrogenase family)/acyl carrier protein
MIFADRAGVGDHIAEQIRGAGLKASCFYAGSSTNGATLAGQAQDILSRSLPQIRGGVGLVYLWPLENSAASDGLPEEVLGQCETVLRIAHHLRAEKQAEVRLWLGTNGALAIDGQEPIIGLSSAALWGLGRSMALEFPDRWGGLVDFDHQDAPVDSAYHLWGMLSRQCAENQVVFRGGAAYVPRIVSVPPPPPCRTDIQADATYLISGGLGALGLHTARWLVEKGAKNLVLFGRRGLTENSEEAVAELAERGIQILALGADVTERDAMQALFQRITTELPPLRGIVHAAGLTGVSPLADLSADMLRTVIAPKVAGALLLDEFARGLDLDFFVLYSSIASIWGSKGQVHYAAANSFLDAVAATRRAQYLPATCVSWGPWDGGGMVAEDDRRTLEQMGIKPMSDAQTAAALNRVLGSRRELVVADVDWPRLHALFESAGGSTLFSRIAGHTEPVPTDRSPESDRFLRQWNSTEESEKPALVRSLVGCEVARILGMPESAAPDPDQGFFELGMDSIMAVDLRKSLEGELQLELSATIAFDFPSTNRLADQLNQLLAGASGSHGFDTVSAAADEKKGDNDPDLAPDDPDTAESAIGASLVRLEALVNHGNASNDSV